MGIFLFSYEYDYGVMYDDWKCYVMKLEGGKSDELQPISVLDQKLKSKGFVMNILSEFLGPR